MHDLVRVTGQAPVTLEWKNVQRKKKKADQKWFEIHLHLIRAEASHTSAKYLKYGIEGQRTYVPGSYWYVRFKTRKLKPTTPHATQETKPMYTWYTVAINPFERERLTQSDGCGIGHCYQMLEMVKLVSKRQQTMQPTDSLGQRCGVIATRTAHCALTLLVDA